MDNLSPWEIAVIVFGLIMGAAATINTLGSAIEKVVKARKAAKAPSDELAEKVRNLETAVTEIRGKLSHDKERLDIQDESNRVTQQALLALLAHGIDGNHVEQMETAKAKLENHLINR